MIAQAFIWYSPDHTVPLPHACLCQAKDRQRTLCVMAAPLLQVDSPYVINTNCTCLTEIVSLWLIICLLPHFVSGTHRNGGETHAMIHKD